LIAAERLAEAASTTGDVKEGGLYNPHRSSSTSQKNSSVRV